MGFQTDCTATGEDRGRFHGSIPPPIYESSLFTFPTYEAFERAYASMESGGDGDWLYSRIGNPTVRTLEAKLALLEQGEDARAFSSGMAAITAAVLSVVSAGEHIVVTRSLYANAFRLFHDYLPRLGISSSFADFTSPDAVESAIESSTRLLYLESPGNPGMQLTDLAAIAEMARSRDLVTIIDGSMATPYNQLPLNFGIDLVLHSATKYLSGHSDVVAGVVIGNRERLQRLAQYEVRDLGATLAPFEAWLILRGLRTLGLRMKAHNESAQRIAAWLEDRAEVERVIYPCLPSHPQHDLACRQMRGGGGMLSVVLRGGMQAAIRFAEHLTYFGIGVSWGGFESLALPIDAGHTAFAGDLDIVPGMVRLSIGLEDTEDLLADLSGALEAIGHD